MKYFKRVFICPNSQSRMPYLKGYKSSMEKEGSVVLVWDRFNHESPADNVIVYRDGKFGMRRGLRDYLKFSIFVAKNIPKTTDSVVVFTSQAFLFCFFSLLNIRRIYLDVRDWHPTFNFIPGFLLNRIDKIFVSSFGFFDLMGVPREKIVLSHNCWNYERRSVGTVKGSDIKVSYIGSVRDYDVNSMVIDYLGNVSGVEVAFYGDGFINKELESLVAEKKIGNVSFHGAYDSFDEDQIFSQSSLINSMIPPSSNNNRRLLTNRLYNAVRNSRPLLVLEGTYLAEMVGNYGLGLIVSGFDNLETEIFDYIRELDIVAFEKNCDIFLEKIKEDMMFFYSCVEEI